MRLHQVIKLVGWLTVFLLSMVQFGLAQVSMTPPGPGSMGLSPYPDASAVLEIVLINGFPASPWEEMQAVRIIRDGRQIPTQLNMLLYSKDEISTVPGATAVLSFFEGAKVAILPDTQFKILSPTGRIAKRGGAYIRTFLNWFTGIRGSFSLQESYVLIASRSTKYLVFVDDYHGRERVSVPVLEGTVTVRSLSGSWAPVSVGPFQQTTLDGSASPQPITRISPEQYNYILSVITPIDQFSPSGQDLPPPESVLTPTSPPSPPSSSQDWVSVPRVIGMHRIEAESVLRTARLGVGRITEVKSSRYQQDVVIGQDPTPGTLVRIGKAVALNIAQAVFPTPKPMPTPTPKATPSPTPKATPSPMPTPKATPSPRPTPKVTLLNIGTSGKLTIIFPNAYVQNNFIRADHTYTFPGKEYPFDYQLTGPCGIEKIRAIATLKPSTCTATDFSPRGDLIVDRTVRDFELVDKRVEPKASAEWAEDMCTLWSKDSRVV